MEVSLSQDEIRLLEDRQSMETREELRRIDNMGRVEALKFKLDRKLSRNLYQKRQVGPLEKKRKTSLTHSRSFRKGKVTRVVKDGEMAQRKKTKSSVHRISAMRREQDEELATIKEMGIVRSHTDDSSSVRRHIHNHLSRMCNHRLLIKPQGHSNHRKKSSVLVTMEDRGGDLAMELVHQQSKVVIEGFMQASSHKLRVLDKLSSNQLQNIKKTILANRHMASTSSDAGMEVNSSVQDAGMKEKEESSPATPTVIPATPSPTVIPATPSPTQPTSSPPHSPPVSPRTSAVQPATPPPVPALPHPPQDLPLLDYFGGVSPSPADENSIVWRTQSEGSNDVVCVECEEFVGVASGGVVGDGGQYSDDDGDDDEDDMVSDHEPGKMAAAMVTRDHAYAESDTIAVAMVTHDHITDKMATAGGGGVAAWNEEFSWTVDNIDDVAARQGDTPLPDPSKQTNPERAIPCEEAHPSSCTLTSDSSSSLGSTHNSSTFSLSDSSPLPRLRHYSSPHLSLSFSAGDLETYPTHHISTHGYYSSVEVEIDPFAVEFQLGVDGSADGACSAPLPLARKPSDIFSPTCHPDGMVRREIPMKAFQDVRFQDYMKTLDHSPPVVQDYITFKMRVIGDHIEETYADKLNQAMDEVFYELVKENLTWNTFKTVSKRLLMQGAKVQDGIMLIPCFARQLVDFVPGLGATIEGYTADVLDNYAADHILGMGGWGSLMASYSEDTGLGDYYQEDEEVWHGGADVSSPSSAPWNQSPNHPNVVVPGSHVTMPIRKRQSPGSSAVDPAPLHLPPILPCPFPLRRCTSVEVLLGDSSEETTPTVTTPTPPPLSSPGYGPMYSRSASINSLNLATPTTPSGHPFVYVCRAQVADSSLTPVTPGPGDGWSGLPSIHEESRLSSRRSSTCSVIIISSHTHLEEGEGFGVVGVGTVESKVSLDRHKSSDSASSSGEYVDLYSNSSQTGSRAGSATPSTRRRRSSVEVIGPLAVATVHAMAAILYVLSS